MTIYKPYNRTLQAYVKHLALFYLGVTRKNFTELGYVHQPSIYTFRDKRTDQIVYVGRSEFPLRRIKRHLQGTTHIGEHINYNNWTNFEVEILMLDDMQEAKEYETFFTKEFDVIENGFNLQAGDDWTEEMKTKLSSKKKGHPAHNKGVPQPRVTCPICGFEGGASGGMTTHLQNCK